MLADFSSLGPTGDGRIKPDVVADGVNVLSSISTADNAYDIYSGTSMATPATAGSSFLLQEYYQKLHGGVFMRSSTLKGLLIHTTDEAGNAPGPDYAYGWGLLNLQRAAGVITSDNTDGSQRIIESQLNGATASQTYTITASGKTPVTATLSWTDPPGVPVNIPSTSHNFKDAGIKLINDLDLRITDNTTGQVYMPWILNPSNPGAAATKGDNIRDNVEKVELNDSMIPGRTYTVSVTHKGSLQTGLQVYSLLMSGGGGAVPCTSAASAGGASVSSVALNGVTVTNNSANCPANIDSSGATAFPLPVGESLPISIVHASCNGSTNNRVIGVYIDFNDNGSFTDAGEQVALSGVIAPGTYAPTIAIPATATVGTYARMRIVVDETTTPGSVSSCGTYAAGGTMDFRVVFTNPSNDVGVKSLEYPTLTTCANDSQLVSIRIHNYGSVPQAKGIPVSTVITNGATTVATLTATCMDSIPAGAEVVFTYNTPFASAAGTSYTFTSKTSLASDVNTGNDTNTTTVAINAAASGATGAATLCGNNATSVVLHAATTGDDVAFWYDNPTATTPIAAGNNTSTTDITSNKTYYLGTNDLKLKAGAPNKMVFNSTSSALAAAYFRFGGNFVMFTTGVPLTIESAKMYIGHSGKITFTLATLASLNNNTGEYSYYPMYTTTIDVYATISHPDTAQQINVAAGDNTDQGATYLLNIPVPNPGNYIIIFDCSNYASALLNANIKTDPYPVTLPGVFSITGNDFRDYGKSDSVSFSHRFYYPFYNIGIRLPGCPGPRKAVVATTEPSPSISQSGNVFTSTAISGNQWYLDDSLLVGRTSDTLQAKFPGLYYTVVTDTVTGCQLTSNKLQFTPTGDANTTIGLTIAPNPNPGVFQLEFGFTTAADTYVTLTNTLGQQVYQAAYPGFSGIFNQQVNVGYLASGIYALRIYHGSSTYTTSIVIRH